MILKRTWPNSGTAWKRVDLNLLGYLGNIYRSILTNALMATEKEEADKRFVKIGAGILC